MESIEENIHECDCDVYTEILVSLAMSYLQLKNYDYAKKIYLKVIKQNTREKAIMMHWWDLGNIYYIEQKYDSALSCFSTAHKKSLDLPYKVTLVDLVVQKGSCYLRLKDYENAISCLSEGLRIKLQNNGVDADVEDRNIAEIRYELGLGLFSLGKEELAIDVWDKALNVDIKSLGHDSIIMTCIDNYVQIGE